MVTFTLDRAHTLTLRASGTEPKLKYYLEVSCPVPEAKYGFGLTMLMMHNVDCLRMAVSVCSNLRGRREGIKGLHLNCACCLTKLLALDK